MNVARLNFSHGSHDYHRSNIERVRRLADEMGANVAIMVDTKGPEIRTGLNEGHKPIRLFNGEQMSVTTKPIASTADCISISYQELPQEVYAGSVIYIDDGLIALTVEQVEGDTIHRVVTNDGVLGERKGVNVPQRCARTACRHRAGSC